MTMTIFLLPLAAVVVVYLVDVGLARNPRKDNKDKKDQLMLPLDTSLADLQPRDSELRSKASSSPR
jgi:hypothetical protein